MGRAGNAPASFPARPAGHVTSFDGRPGCSLVSVFSHRPGRQRVMAAALGAMTALSTVALAGAGFSTVPTHSQIGLALIGSVLAGCLAGRAGWPTTARAVQKIADTIAPDSSHSSL